MEVLETNLSGNGHCFPSVQVVSAVLDWEDEKLPAEIQERRIDFIMSVSSSSSSPSSSSLSFLRPFIRSAPSANYLVHLSHQNFYLSIYSFHVQTILTNLLFFLPMCQNGGRDIQFRFLPRTHRDAFPSFSSSSRSVSGSDGAASLQRTRSRRTSIMGHGARHWSAFSGSRAYKGSWRYACRDLCRGVSVIHVYTLDSYERATYNIVR